MKSCEDMVRSLLARRDEYDAARKRRKRIAVRAAVPLTLVLLAAALTVGARLGRSDVPPEPDVPPVPVESPTSGAFVVEPPTDSVQPDDAPADAPMRDDIVLPEPEPPQTDESVVSGTVLPSGAGVVAEDTCIFWWRQKLRVTGELYWALEDDPLSAYPVRAVYRPATAEITDFVYEGRTLADWATALDTEWERRTKLEELLKLGDALKYGAALYETGTPEGEKWAKSFYDDKVAFYGELLEQYIVDGVFLRDAVERDLAAMQENPARAQYERAYSAYLSELLPREADAVAACGLACTAADDALHFTATADELELLPLDDPTHWVFHLDK